MAQKLHFILLRGTKQRKQVVLCENKTNVLFYIHYFPFKVRANEKKTQLLSEQGKKFCLFICLFASLGFNFLCPSFLITFLLMARKFMLSYQH